MCETQKFLLKEDSQQQQKATSLLICSHFVQNMALHSGTETLIYNVRY